jgi:hypothetical protein
MLVTLNIHTSHNKFVTVAFDDWIFVNSMSQILSYDLNSIYYNITEHKKATHFLQWINFNLVLSNGLI